jgi:polysaccharide export outer membrane protein
MFLISARVRPRLALFLGAAPALIFATCTLAASANAQAGQAQAARQAVESRLGRAVSVDEIERAVRTSGLTPQQIRARLQAAGYDPALAEPFLGGREGTGVGAAGTASSSPQTQGFAEALQALGLLRIGDAASEVLPSSRVLGEVPTGPLTRTTANSGDSQQPFGRALFQRTGTMFQPVLAGPVDPSYRLDAGDQLQLVLTGAVEQIYSLEVRRDGTLLIPSIGQITVAGLTLDAARTVVSQRGARVYGALAEGRANLDLSVSRVRTNSVFVIGEVEEAGAYQVNALSTVFHAIARAGGPTERGSFRNIEVRRGGRVVRRVDLYKYLLDGETQDDIRTEQGDVIFVPLATRTVSFVGAVRRPGTFELRPDEGFVDLLRFAGGLLATAANERLQIDRVLPPSQRTPGVDRVLLDVMLHGDPARAKAMPLMDNDIVRAFSVGARRRETVELVGEVVRPGTYQLDSAMTVGALLDRAQGPLPWGLTDRVKLTRPVPQTGRSDFFSLDLGSPEGRNFVLREFDRLEVLDSRLANPRTVITVGGAVRTPRDVTFADRLTLRDALDLAGGLREEAQGIELSRRRTGSTYADTTSILFRFDTGPNGALRPADEAFVIQRDDRIFVRTSPGFRRQTFVQLTGLFKSPGTYAVNIGTDRISSLVSRAGGTLPGAYVRRFRLVRAGRPVAIDFANAMRGKNEDDLLLEDGDLLTIGNDPATVLVIGEVARPALIAYEPGRSMSDYIELAGGAKVSADMGRAIVEDPTGAVRRSRRYFRLFHSSPEIASGAVIQVPARPPEQPGRGREALTTIVQLASSLASLTLAYVAIVRR